MILRSICTSEFTLGYAYTYWFFNGDVLLSEKAKQSIIEIQHRKFFSMVSVWEIAIKISLHKLAFDGKTKEFLDLINSNGFELLSVKENHILE